MKTVPELIAHIEHLVPEGAPFGTRAKASLPIDAPVGRLDVAVAARIDAKGGRRLQYWCDGIRVERHVLLRLTCPEGACPQSRAIRAQWQDFLRGERAPAEPAAAFAPSPQPLIQDLPLRFGRADCVARPASFRCFTPCPNGAHPPMQIDQPGFDLFEDGRCVGGGVVTGADGVRRPRLPTLQSAEAFVLARRLEAMAAVAGARDATDRRSD